MNGPKPEEASDVGHLAESSMVMYVPMESSLNHPAVRQAQYRTRPALAAPIMAVAKRAL
jgi:hypothetical protein